MGVFVALVVGLVVLIVLVLIVVRMVVVDVEVVVVVVVVLVLIVVGMMVMVVVVGLVLTLVVMVVVVGLVVYRMALVPRSARTQAARLQESSAPLVLCSAYNTNKLARSLGSKRAHVAVGKMFRILGGTAPQKFNLEEIVAV